LKRANKHLDLVRRSYSSPQAIGRYAERTREGLRRWESNVLQSFVVETGAILDIGCGGGREAFALEQLGFQITGIDISEAQVESARCKAVELGSRVEFRIYDGKSLEFPEESFDSITLWSQVLCNVPGTRKRAELLRECYKVLKPGGTLSLSAHDKERTGPLLSADQVVERGPSESLEEDDLILCSEEGSALLCYWHYFTRSELEEVCRLAGFEKIDVFHTSELGET
jgi:SAM-dependent methyltransferase